MTLTLEICINTLHVNFLLWTREVASNSNIRGGANRYKIIINFLLKICTVLFHASTPMSPSHTFEGLFELTQCSSIGPSTRLVYCTWSYRGTRIPFGCVALSRAFIANLECAFVKKRTLIFVAPKIGEGSQPPFVPPSTTPLMWTIHLAKRPTLERNMMCLWKKVFLFYGLRLFLCFNFSESRHIGKRGGNWYLLAPKVLILKCDFQETGVPYSNRISPWLTEFGPLPWQTKQTVSALCQLQPAI